MFYSKYTGMSKFKVYTKTGDKGSTALIGGKRVSKSDARIEAYGTIDELLSYIGLLRDFSKDEKEQNFLINIQDNLMDVAAVFAYDGENSKVKVPSISDEDIKELEDAIDEMDKFLPQIDSFILPGGHQAVSFCHIARTVCRRAERRAIAIEDEIRNGENAKKYINRLSDYLFTLGRKFGIDYNIKEIKWVPRFK